MSTAAKPVPALSALASALASSSGFIALERAALDPSRSVVAPLSLRPFVLAHLARQRRLLVVTATGREAEDLTTELRALAGDCVAYFPSWETLPHERLSPAADTIGRRREVLHALAGNEGKPFDHAPGIVVTTVRSLVQPIPRSAAAAAPLVLRVEQDTAFDEALVRLNALAYSRVDMVAKRGEFAVRGGIVDIFPATAEHPVRVEFFGDTVAEIRHFSVADQRSLVDGESDTVTLYACRELLLTDAVRECAGKLAEEHDSEPPLVEMLRLIEAGVAVDGMEGLMSVLSDDGMALLPELMPPETAVVLCDPEKSRRRATDLVQAGREFLEASWDAATMGAEAPVDSQTLDLTGAGFRSLTAVQNQLADSEHGWWNIVPPGFLFDEDTADTAGTPNASGANAPIVISAEDPPSPHGIDDAVATTFAHLRAHVASGGKAAIVLPGKGSCDRTVERLLEAETPARVVAAGDPLPSDSVAVIHSVLHHGFVVEDIALVVMSEPDLTGHRVAGTTDGRSRPARRRHIVDPLALTAGDMVVHDQHGIGKFVEMVERTVRTGEGTSRREYLVIEYAASKRGHPGDRLFVPMDSLDQLSRYVGGEAPALSKMGGSDWQNTKRKARKAVREIATELVQLYAARYSAPGHAFAPDSPWQRELEDAFPFTETVDQMTVINEVKDDMEKPVPMDRVVIGDVGYGKTEVAVRAAFKAVQDGRQVAVLVPTTLLAQQHLQTFRERMTGFPVTIEGLSRFSSPADTKKVLAGLAAGEVDIVIGTHRLLQNGVQWKNLGLVVVDEEQRFGVEHKEHIKALRTHVDILTMSATPIPRTLEMSMAGIREMSTILTPPEERLPILTYVGPQSDKQVAAAIRRELLRDGQIFYLHNRVSTIDGAAAHLRDLVPEARIAIAHGQMNEDNLESTVDGFWRRDYDVLVCTTIVETGLDISNANTLIVERADQLGLSQLHQLRGRVGRSRERGYAYFLHSPQATLTETAYDRLATIAQNNDLGAGMAVAMKDLELRGAGNVLGAQQSGHIAGVGFDLYVRLVGEAVEAYKAIADGRPVEVEEENTEVRIDLPVDAHIPVDYVTGDRLRLEAYRKLAEARSIEDIAAANAELTDRYGIPPEPVRLLMSIARLRLLCREYGVREVVQGGTRLRVSPLDLADSKQMRLKRLHPAAQYRPTQKLVLLPLPKIPGRALGTAGGSEKVRDEDVMQFVANFIAVMSGLPEGSVSVVGPLPVTSEPGPDPERTAGSERNAAPGRAAAPGRKAAKTTAQGR